MPSGTPRFSNVSCSQCGRDFGAGNHGFSHCGSHGADLNALAARAIEQDADFAEWSRQDELTGADMHRQLMTSERGRAVIYRALYLMRASNESTAVECDDAQEELRAVLALGAAQ